MTDRYTDIVAFELNKNLAGITAKKADRVEGRREVGARGLRGLNTLYTLMQKISLDRYRNITVKVSNRKRNIDWEEADVMGKYCKLNTIFIL
ncbi:MAG: hypothetical protein AABY22_32360, partial [Nanoarchaeota archaeon]